MGDRKEKLEKKLAKAKEGLAKVGVDYKKLLKAQKDYEYLKARVEKITKLLSEL